MSTFAAAAKIASLRCAEVLVHLRAGDSHGALTRLAGSLEPLGVMAECYGEPGKTRRLFVAGERIKDMLPRIDTAIGTHRLLAKALERLAGQLKQEIPTPTRRALHELGVLARGVASPLCLERCAWVTRWLDDAAGGAAGEPDDFRELVRQVDFVVEEIERGLPDPAVWRGLAHDSAQLVEAAKDLPSYLAGPPPPDVKFLDQHPEIERQEFEFVHGVWLERRPRSIA